MSEYAVDHFAELYAPRREGLGFGVADHDLGMRSAWALIGEWLVAWAVGHHDGDATIGATHAWFWGNGQEASLPSVLHDWVVRSAPSTHGEVHALLPYLLDPSSVGTRRNVLDSKADWHERESRKRSGVYYTPGDVTAYMVERIKVTADGRSATTWLDPAQGSGAFLRAVLSLADDPMAARDGLYGIDVDRFAAEAASFVLTAEDLLLNPIGHSPGERWHHFRRNFATANTLFLDVGAAGAAVPEGLWSTTTGDDIASFFPEISARGFSRVIANPPYAKLAPDSRNSSLGGLHPVTGSSVAADISPVFVELGTRLLSAHGAMCMVLPLSHVTSSRQPFPALRSFLANERGRVDFESYDRVPDALFGDDIKTRNAIITLDRTAPDEVTTTSLRRWTSRRRDRAFSSISRVPITGLPGSPARLPKIGADWERDLYLACTDHAVTVGKWVRGKRSVAIQHAQLVDSSHWSQMVAIAPTAYNFLGVTRDASQSARDGHDSTNAVSLLRFDSAQDASAAYALLSSRFAFWLWHVTGDGFHTSGKLPWYVPAPSEGGAVERLADLGEELWQLASKSPTVSRNRGRTTLSYPTWMYRDALTRIDSEVDTVLGTNMADRLAIWHEELMVVDAESERLEMVLRKSK